jgi:hypothetical protein
MSGFFGSRIAEVDIQVRLDRSIERNAHAGVARKYFVSQQREHAEQ